MSKLGNVPHRYARYAEIMFYEDASGLQTFKYGKLGELTENIRTFALPFESRTYTFKMQYEYDSWNRIQRMTYPDGEVVTYGYNLGGLLERVSGRAVRQNVAVVHPDPERSGGQTPTPEPTVAYNYPYIDSIAYNKFEQKDTVWYGNGTRVAYAYDSLQRLLHLRSYEGHDSLMQDIAYTYDAAGNIQGIQNTAAALPNGLGGAYRNTYKYDDLYRLSEANCQGTIVEMSYHANGRIHRKTVKRPITAQLDVREAYMVTSNDYAYNINQPNTLKGVRSYTYHSNSSNQTVEADSWFRWDGCGNMVFHEDVPGNLSRNMVWTEENRLLLVADNSHLSLYLYDAGGERAYKLTGDYHLQNTNGQWFENYTLTTPTLYASPYLVANRQGYTKHYYAGSERIVSKIGGGGLRGTDVLANVSSVNTLWDEVVAQTSLGGRIRPQNPQMNLMQGLYDWQDSVQPENDCYWYHPDHLGSASWVTDADGSAVQHLEYLPWGEDFVDQRLNSFDGVRYTFSAKEKDTETGYSYFGARYYSSDLSIWLSVDPMAAKYPSLSPYVYCANNPVKLVDPNGEKIWIHDEEGGSAANAYYQELDKWANSENINLSLGTDGYLNASFDGEYTDLSDEAQNFLHAVYNPNITVDILATSNDYGDNGYAFFCGTYKKVVYGYSKGEEVAHSYQVVNPNDLRQFDEYHQQPGQTSLHELMESYNAALMSISNCSSDDEGKRKYYKSSHQNAPPQSGTFKVYYTKNGRDLRKKLPSVNINPSKWYIYYSSESGDKIFKKIPITNR